MDKKIEKLIRNYTIEDLEGILDKLPYQVWLKDKDGKHIYINKLGNHNIISIVENLTMSTVNMQMKRNEI